MSKLSAIAKIASNLAMIEELLEQCKALAESEEIQFKVSLIGSTDEGISVDSTYETWQASGMRC